MEGAGGGGSLSHNMVLFQNPDYMQEKFIIKIETLHLPDRGTTENVSYNTVNKC